MSARDDAIRLLAELAELGMDVTRRVQQAAAAAPETADAIALTEAFCDASRGVRQTIALWMRIETGSFGAPRAASPADAPLDDEPEEQAEPPEWRERADWNEYERPDYETPLRLTGDEAQDGEAIRVAVETAVTRIRRRYAKAEAVLASRPEPRRSNRAALLGGAAPLRLTDTS